MGKNKHKRARKNMNKIASKTVAVDETPTDIELLEPVQDEGEIISDEETGGNPENDQAAVDVANQTSVEKEADNEPVDDEPTEEKAASDQADAVKHSYDNEDSVDTVLDIEKLPVKEDGIDNVAADQVAAEKVSTQPSSEERFKAITVKMGKLNISVDPSNPQAIVATRSDLEDIISDLEQFQTDCKMNGDAEHIPTLLTDIEQLLSQTHVLHGHISKQMHAMHRMDNVDSDAGDDAGADADASDSEELLSREEISKLLLLTNKAYQAQHIDLNQKAFLKDEIVRRKGYLRKVVEQEDFANVLTTLALFAQIP